MKPHSAPHQRDLPGYNFLEFRAASHEECVDSTGNFLGERVREPCLEQSEEGLEQALVDHH